MKFKLGENWRTPRETCLNSNFMYGTINVTRSESTPVVQWLSYSPLDPRFAGSIPAGVDGFFQSIKILSMSFFGR